MVSVENGGQKEKDSNTVILSSETHTTQAYQSQARTPQKKKIEAQVLDEHELKTLIKTLTNSIIQYIKRMTHQDWIYT